MGYTNLELQKEYQREWRAARRAGYFADKSCAICGATDDLELDHIDWSLKKYSPSALWSMSEDNPNRISELKKCQVLCTPHHKQKSRADKIERRKHGRTLYSHGCRCSICYDAKVRDNLVNRRG